MKFICGLNENLLYILENGYTHVKYTCSTIKTVGFLMRSLF